MKWNSNCISASLGSVLDTVFLLSQLQFSFHKYLLTYIKCNQLKTFKFMHCYQKNLILVILSPLDFLLLNVTFSYFVYVSCQKSF